MYPTDCLLTPSVHRMKIKMLPKPRRKAMMATHRQGHARVGATGIGACRCAENARGIQEKRGKQETRKGVYECVCVYKQEGCRDEEGGEDSNIIVKDRERQRGGCRRGKREKRVFAVGYKAERQHLSVDRQKARPATGRGRSYL